MERSEIKNIVVEFLIDEFEIEQDVIADDAHLIDDLGLESLDFVDIVVIIEKEFGFKVKREEMKDIRVLNDLYDYIEKNM
ncbi:acyl carrier protein [Carboxylicivirga sp. N1Y90]|uniref:acyl carrier protein n=1 Tax=Carboxylicivirga fragile TaxID=3417571 RepID=UPI003D3576AF|nr:hypothetical protein [Marinilabiliaceae bacterium N1Y90]